MNYERSRWFFDAFNNIFSVESESRKNAILAYPHNTDFTDFIIDRINTIIREKGYCSQNEYFRIDSMGYKSRYKELNKISGFNRHFWDLEIAVEHENDKKDWLDEIIKLAHICCPLRVVIGYVPIKLRSDDQVFLDYAAEALKKLQCKDNVKTGEFMVILGNGDTKGHVEYYFNYQAYVLDPETIKFKPL